MKKEKKFKQKRGRGFGFFKGFLKIFIRKPKIVYLGKEVDKPSIILSNHVGKTAPLTLELYFKTPFRYWGTYEMNGSLKSVYKYMSEVFYHQKKGWNLFLARLFCIIAAPLAFLFYRGLRLISTYPDHRFRRTIKESLETIKGGESLVIFPEDSSKGYFDELTYFYSGFLLLAKKAYKQGNDMEIYLSYYRKKDRTYVVDKPFLYSQYLNCGLSREEIAERARQKVNELGKMDLKELLTKKEQ